MGWDLIRDARPVRPTDLSWRTWGLTLQSRPQDAGRRTPHPTRKAEGCREKGQRRGSPVRTPGLDPGLLIGEIKGVPVGPWTPGRPRGR